MVGCYHRCDGHEFEQALGTGDGRWLPCCSPWVRKEYDTTERLNWTEGWRNSTQERVESNFEAVSPGKHSLEINTISGSPLTQSAQLWAHVIDMCCCIAIHNLHCFWQETRNKFTILLSAEILWLCGFFCSAPGRHLTCFVPQQPWRSLSGISVGILPVGLKWENATHHTHHRACTLLGTLQTWSHLILTMTLWHSYITCHTPIRVRIQTRFVYLIDYVALLIIQNTLNQLIFIYIYI